MKTTYILTFLILIFSGSGASAQKTSSSEKYGSALNIGVGIGGYGYYGRYNHSLPVISVNYELDVAKNFTLAPSLGFYTYNDDYYWGNKNNPYKYYHYHETVIIPGVKGTYYFDDLLKANSKWDFYLAASLGFAIVNSSWDGDYYGDKNYYRGSSSLFLDLHIGTEYHINNRVGLFLDISTRVSTIGLAIH